MPNVTLLGATGSIGRQTREVCAALKIPIVAMSAHTDAAGLADAARAANTKAVCIADETKYQALKAALADTNIVVTAGREALCALAALPKSDVVVNAIVGMAGLWPTLSGIDAGKTIALANKETLVAAGDLVMTAVQKKGVTLYPVDSEHSAIFQCLQSVQGPDARIPFISDPAQPRQLKKILLTASGGPFYGKTRAQLEQITPQMALQHPTWSMGAKITIDSATLMNKGLEVIEACHLFGVTPDQIEVLVHRESVLHSAVEFADLGVIGQMGTPDMRLPIQYALTYPKRLPCPVRPLSLTDLGTLHFAKPDEETFSCLSLCKRAMQMGGTAPLVINSANEVAVARFLKGEIGFLQIGALCAAALEHFGSCTETDLVRIAEKDNAVRAFATSFELKRIS